MLNANLLRAAMAAVGYNQKQLAEAINMPEGTMSRKIRTGMFYIDEACEICDVLGIKDPKNIFFAHAVN